MLQPEYKRSSMQLTALKPWPVLMTLFFGARRGVEGEEQSCRPLLSTSHVPVLTLYTLTSLFIFKKCRTFTSKSPTTHTHQLLPVVVTVFSTLLPDLSCARFILPSHTRWLMRLAKEIPSSDRRKIGDFHTSFLTNKKNKTNVLLKSGEV